MLKRMIVAASMLLIVSSAFAACGDRGGPGGRKANGQCCSWAEHQAGRNGC
jgi:hypothetical protein